MTDDLAKLAERALLCRIIQQEGPEAIGVKPRWNWQPCIYSGRCDYQAEREKSRPKPCSFNPGMFTCSAYQKYALGQVS